MAFSKDDTYNKVVQIIAEKTSIPKENIVATSTFKDLGVDSLDQAELLMNFEDAFEVKIEDAEIAGINTIQDLVNLLHSKRTK